MKIHKESGYSSQGLQSITANFTHLNAKNWHKMAQ